MSADLNTVLESATLPEDAVEVARIGEAWGVRGWFRIIPYSSLPEAPWSSSPNAAIRLPGPRFAGNTAP